MLHIFLSVFKVVVIVIKYLSIILEYFKVEAKPKNYEEAQEMFKLV